MKSLFLVAVLIAAASPALAGSYPDVTDASTVDAGGKRVLQQSIVLKAPPRAVWDAILDPPTVRRWSAPVALIDLKQGGTMEESYDPKAKPGDPENIRHDILAYVPGRLMVFRNSNAPSRLPGRELYKQVTSILEVTDLGQGRTRLSLTQTGYGQAPDFDKLYAFFSEDNAWLMEELKKALESPDGKLHNLVK